VFTKGIDMKNLIRVFVIAVSLLSLNAHSYRAYTGNQILEYCKNWDERGTPSELQDAAFCQGYIAGALEVIEARLSVFVNKDKNGLDRLYCKPETVTDLQVTAVIIKYLKDNPVKLDRVANYLISDALIAAWPCKTETPTTPQK
jgi:hypothetical protein